MSKKFAQIENNIVSNIVIADDEWISNQSGEWIPFSDETIIGVGFEYNRVNNVFISPQPFPSWSLNNDYVWVAPVAKPDGDYVWSEESLSWVTPFIA